MKQPAIYIMANPIFHSYFSICHSRAGGNPVISFFAGDEESTGFRTITISNSLRSKKLYISGMTTLLNEAITTLITQGT